MAAATLILLNVVILVAGLRGAWRVIKWRNARADAPPVLEPGAFAVPVRELSLNRNSARNGLWPKMTVTPTGLRFKIFRETFWAYDEIKQVDYSRTIFGGSEVVFDGKRGRLAAQLADAGAARNLLRALSTTMRLTERAAALRDGAA